MEEKYKEIDKQWENLKRAEVDWYSKYGARLDKIYKVKSIKEQSAHRSWPVGAALEILSYEPFNRLIYTRIRQEMYNRYIKVGEHTLQSCSKFDHNKGSLIVQTGSN